MTTTSVAPTRTRSLAWVEPITAIWSALAAALAGWWLVNSSAYPEALSDPTSHASLVALLEPRTVSLLLTVLGLVGVLVATAGIRTPNTAVARRLLVAASAAYAVVFGLVAPDLSLLVAMGYLSAILGPPVLLVVLTAGAVRDRGTRLVLAGTATVVVLAGWAFGVRMDSFARFGRDLASGFERSSSSILLALAMFSGGVLWLLTLVRQVRRSAPQQRRTAAAAMRGGAGRLDWGRWVTIAAALCPLPYGLLRMTWFTPWPVMVDSSELVANPALRVFGLCLGLAALAGSALTCGLIARWGEVYPRWVPMVRGRAVSPTWPTVVALVVAAAITVAGRSMIQMVLMGSGGTSFTAEALLIFPFPAWGPLLAAAAVAYYLRRTPAGMRPHPV